MVVVFGPFHVQFSPIVLVSVGHFLCVFVLVVALVREVVEERYSR